MFEFASVIGYLVVSGGMSAVLLLLVWLSDRYEREPFYILLLAAAWGALPSVFLSCLFESILGIPIAAMAGAGTAEVLTAVLLAPPVEEIVKAIALLLAILLFRREFDDVLDGMTYGAAVGIGFSFVEDFGYFLGGVMQSGVTGGGIIFALRNFGFILNHSLFTALTGIGFGLARTFHKDLLARFGWPIIGLSAAIALHATHNLLACFDLPGLFLALFVHWIGGIGLLCIIPLLWALERKWIIQRLTSEVYEGKIPGAALAALPFSGRRASLPPMSRAPLKQALVQLAFHRRMIEDGWAPESAWEADDLRDRIRRLVGC